MITLRYRTLVAFLAGIALTITAGFALQTWSAEAAPGDSDTTLVPITPCRLLDTRPDTQVGPRDTPIGEDSPVAFTAWDSGDDDSTCEIPDSATAISTNTTTVNPTKDSFLTLYPADDEWPGTANLNYVAAQAPTPNAVTIPLSPTGMFNVYNRFGTVDVVIDINGFYTKASLQELTSRIAALEATDFLMEHERTTGVYDGGNSSTALTDSPKVVASVTVDQATSGRVILNSSATVWGDKSVGKAECSITTSSKVLDSNYLQGEETLTDAYASISGTRGYIVNKGSIFSPDQQIYNLVCKELGGDTYILDANLSAVFVPDPKVFKKIGPGLP